MAIFHMAIKIVGRSKGKSIIAASAYLNGDVMKDYEIGRTSYYTSKSEVVYTNLMMCEHAPPEWSDVPDENIRQFKQSTRYKRSDDKDRDLEKFLITFQKQRLWNEVLKIESESNAQLGRSFEFSLPVEWGRQEQITITKDYIQKQFVDKGMCADWSIHDKGDGNPHVHLLLTMRPFGVDGTWGKKEVKDWAFELDREGQRVINPSHPNWWQDKKDSNRCGIRIPIVDEEGMQKVGARNRKQWKRVLVDSTGWNNPHNCEFWRSEWAKSCNLHLSKEKWMDHRSFARQGKIEIPTIHEGTSARMIHQKFEKGLGIEHSWKIEKNRNIREQNNLLQKVQGAFANVTAWLKQWKENLDDVRREQLYDSDHGRNDSTVRGTTGIIRRGVSRSGETEQTYSGVRNRKSAMARLITEAEQREPFIADTKRRIDEIHQRIKKARDMNERFRKLTARRTGTGDVGYVGRTADGNRENGQDYKGAKSTSERIAGIKRETELREQHRERASIKEQLEASRRILEERERKVSSRYNDHSR